MNKANRDSWRPLLPHYDPEMSEITDDNSLCMLGRDAKGDVVLTQVARYFNWTDTNLHDEIINLRLFYKDPPRMSQPTEAAFVYAPMAKNIKGRVAFTGGLWCRPDYRGKGLPGISPRIARCIAIARWNVDTACTIIAPEVHQRGVAQRGAYHNVEWGVRLVNNPFGTLNMALLWATRDEMVADFEHYLQSTTTNANITPDRSRQK